MCRGSPLLRRCSLLLYHAGPRPGTAREHCLRLTGRSGLPHAGGVVCIALVSMVSALLATAVEYPPVNGASFVLACILTAVAVRPSDLLALSVNPPLAYFCGALVAECFLSVGGESVLRGVVIGVGVRLADAAPWLFVGTALLLVITFRRGLPQNVRELSNELNARHRRRGSHRTPS